MKSPFKLTWRISDRIWSDDAQFEALLSQLLRHGDTADELALFIAEPSNYVYDPLPRVAKELEIFKRRAEALRPRGIAAGINFWPTFGSGSAYEKSPLRPPLPFPPVAGMDGSVEDSIACPISPEFLAYTREKYTLAAKAGPDFIWVDDDTRFTHLGGVPYPCFCERCVSGFEGGRFASRVELVAALNAPANRDAAPPVVRLRRRPPGPLLRRGPRRGGRRRPRHRHAFHDRRPHPHHLRRRLHREVHGRSSLQTRPARPRFLLG